MTLAVRFEEWAQQHELRGMEKGRQEGRQEGRLEGRAEGEARVLRRLLVARFGPLSQQTLAALHSADSEQLEAWTDRLLGACTLAEVFGPGAVDWSPQAVEKSGRSPANPSTSE